MQLAEANAGTNRVPLRFLGHIELLETPPEYLRKGRQFFVSAGFSLPGGGDRQGVADLWMQELLTDRPLRYCLKCQVAGLLIMWVLYLLQ